MLLRSVAVLIALASMGCGDAAAPPAPDEGGAGTRTADVQVAVWTPTDVQMAASGRGALAVAGGCLALTYGSGEAVLPVFPYGSTTWDPATETLTFGGETYQIGDTLQYGGGSVGRGSHRLGEGARFIPPCEIERPFLVSPPRPLAAPAGS